jgi:hypothetical protein
MEKGKNNGRTESIGVDEKQEALKPDEKLKQGHEPQQPPGPNAHVKGAKKRGFLRRIVWPVVRIPLYLAFLAGIVVLLLAGLEKMAEYALSRSAASQIYPNRIFMTLKDFTKPVSHYDYDFNPGVCIEYNRLKGNRYEYANNAGFRDPRDISMEKPEDEYRIFLVGGSTAYGLGAVGEAAPAMNFYGIPFRETIAHQMEMILNATAPMPGKRIRVYNTAVWGYAYQHHLMRYVTKLRRYKPDLVVSLDGANEIPPICKLTENWDYFKEGQFNNILQHIFAYNEPGLSSYLTLWLKNNTYLMTYLWGGRDIFQELHQGGLEGTPEGSWEATSQGPEQNAGTAGPQDGRDQELARKSRLADRNVNTVVRVVENYHSSLENDEVPHLFALQPWLYLSKKKLTEQEKTLSALTGTRTYYGIPSDKMYQLLINRITGSARKKGYFVVDFSQYFDDVTEWVFTDWCHLTAGANYLVAKELANLVKSHFFKLPLTQGDLVDDKNSFFWDFAASSKVAYAPPPASPETGIKKALAGYPGKGLYESVVPSGKEKAEIVLDAGGPYPMSRLRLVWADAVSVPEKWIVEVSIDRENWLTFAEATNKQTDNYSQWPGFEFFAAEPMQTRYIRYRPLGGENKPIKLRSWNMYR